MANGTVRVICPNLKCRAILSAPGAARGKSVRCRMCGQKVRIGTGAVKPAPVAALPDDAQSAAGDKQASGDTTSK